jgi:hypothetical protein
MTKWFREHGIDIFMLAVKGLTAAVTASATWEVSHNILYVAAIDVIFTSLWLIVAYGGNSNKLMALRPVAVPLAIAMYLSMVVIGWEAYADWVSIVVRMAGLGMLLFDSYGFAVDYMQKRASTADRRAHTAYERMMRRRSNRAMLFSGFKLQSHMNTLTFEMMRDDLPQIIAARLQKAQCAPQSVTVSTPTPTAKSTVSAWATVSALLNPGDEFDRQFVEDKTGYKRTKAGQIIDYGLHIGEVEEAGYGQYIRIL